MSTLVIRPMEATQEGLQAYRSIGEQNGKDWPIDVLKWRYFENPYCSPTVDFAIEEETGRMAGLYAVMAVPFTFYGREIKAVQSLDTLVDQGFRKRGLFTSLGSSNYARAQTSDIELVYGFPNGNSYHGFQKYLGWNILDPVPFIIRPLRTGFALAKLIGSAGSRLDLSVPRFPVPLPPGTRLVDIHHFDPRFDALWERCASRIKVGLRRDATYLDWRFMRRPDSRYSTIAIERDDAIQGFATYRVVDREWGRVGQILEFLFAPDERMAGLALMAETLRRLGRGGAELALAMNTANSYNAWCYRVNGFVTAPASTFPGELHFGSRVFSGDTTKREDWYISLADSDTH